MHALILEKLQALTEEEIAYKSGRSDIEKELYMESDSSQITASRLLESGKLITVRKHTRFVHFPVHTHNYVEVVYMCQGSTTHMINGKELVLRQGELLFLNQNSEQEILPAGEEDIAINFIILPEFFDYGLTMLQAEENQLKDFIIGCMTGKSMNVNYLHFKVADAQPIQNLIENLVWTLVNRQPYKQLINQATMGLLLMQLMNYMDSLDTDAKEEMLMVDVLRYIDDHYKDGELRNLAELLHYDLYWLSREIKKQTGQNYTDLVQNKRLAQASYLLLNTNMVVSDVGLAVGYENISYFHRIFQKKYGVTPRKYRIMNNTEI